MADDGRPGAKSSTDPLGWSELFDPDTAGTNESVVPFLSVAHALAESAAVVAEVGCGRGAWSEVSKDRVPLQDLRGTGRRVIGIDIDLAGTENPMIDEFRQIGPDWRWPLESGSVDLAVSDWVLEHVTEPTVFVAELSRVLRPGGAFVARTVSRYSPLSMGARAVPNDRHAQVLEVLQPGRDAKDVFPTAYLMNSRRALSALLDDGFEWTVSHRSDLRQYFHRWPRVSRAIAACEPHLPRTLRTTLVVYARKIG